jgi:MFS family permease
LTSSPRNRLPPAIWALGFVSLLMDVSSEMVHSLLPVFLVTAVGASGLVVGVIEGLAEGLALVVKVFSGVLSDYWGKRKGLAIIGYGLGALSKPLFALASGAGLVLVARLIDRTGKGIRGAPRDALMADITPADMRGEAYGLRQSLDSVGAFLGPLLAVGLMVLWANDFQAVFWVAVIPGLLAVLVLVLGVREPLQQHARRGINPIRRESLRRLSRPYWIVVLLGASFSLARFSEAFLLLRAEQGGLALSWIPLVMVIMNVVYSLSAYPVGRLADRMSHTALLTLGLVVLLVADLVLATGNHWTVVLLGVALWGLHLGMTHGLLAAMVAHTAPADLRGTAFGAFYLVSGLALLIASVVAGLLWDEFGAAATFLAGAGFSSVTLLCLLWLRKSGIITDAGAGPASE